ncbi:hypothetical protein D3C84_432360 [compost metagenome]
MGFVHQHGDLPLAGLGQAEQQRAEVEIVVVVGNHQVSPAGHLLTQVIRAYLVFEGNLAQRGLMEQRELPRRRPRRRQAVIEAMGQWAGLAMTGFVQVLAGLVAGNHLQHAQWQAIAAVDQHLRGIQRQFASRRLGREEEHLVQLLGHPGLEHREQGAQGLADAGGGLGHQATPGADGLEHRLRQVALPGTEVRVRENQLLCALIAGISMGHFLLGPVQE